MFYSDENCSKSLVRLGKSYGNPVKKTPFKGNNLITENIATVRRLRNGVLYELSWGLFLKNYWVGITFTHPDPIKRVEIEAKSTVLSSIDQLDNLLRRVELS